MMDDLLQQAIGLHRAGDLTRAEELYRRVLAAQPANADALHYLGMLLSNRGNHADGIALLRQAIAISPTTAQYHNNLAEALRSTGNLAEAEQEYRQTIALRPDHPLAWYNLGLLYAAQNRAVDAIRAYRNAIARNRSFVQAYNNLAIQLSTQGQLDEAMELYRQAISIAPNVFATYVNLAMLLGRMKRYDEAIGLCARALELAPNHAETHYNMATLCASAMRRKDAADHYRRAIELEPRHQLALNNLGNIYREIGEPDRAAELFARSQQIQSDPDLAVNLIAAHYHSTSTPPDIVRQEHEYFADNEFANLPRCTTWSNPADPEKRIRIGYISPDFREHSVAYFLEPLLSNHDRVQFEIFCYSDVTKPDAVTQRLRAHADAWRDTNQLSHERLAELVREDGIDVLIDLAGQTTGNRLAVFARKPAPLALSGLGYSNTTGLKEIDYRLTDAIADPPGSERFYTEKLLRLPGCFLCYRIPGDLPEVSELPARAKRFITFGCFNVVAKINRDVTRLWARLLHAVPQSRLFLKSLVLNDAATRDMILERLEQDGIPHERLTLLGRTKTTAEHLALYRDIDIALDPFPYNGTTTTCEAMAMGVPVVALQGQSQISRVGMSLLTAVGLPAWIAATQDDYLRIAARWAQDPDALASLRASLRQKMTNSILCDEVAYALKFENMVREIWRAWCAKS